MNTQLSALVGVIVVVVIAAVLVLAVVLTGHTDTASLQLVTTVLGFAGTIILVLLGLAGLKGKVEEIHGSINGRMGELISTTAASAHARGVVEGMAKALPLAAPPVPLEPPAVPAEPLEG